MDRDVDDVMNQFQGVTAHASMEEQHAAFARQAAEREIAEAARAEARAKAAALNYIKKLINDYGLKANASRVYAIHGPDITKIEFFLKAQHDANKVSNRASTNSFLSSSSSSSSGIHKLPTASTSTKPSIVPTKRMDGGKKSRRNTHRRKYSKKQKPSRKQTRRHRYRRSRHRR